MMSLKFLLYKRNFISKTILKFLTGYIFRVEYSKIYTEVGPVFISYMLIFNGMTSVSKGKTKQRHNYKGTKICFNSIGWTSKLCHSF
jgi:hypothetical protein